MRIFVGNLSYDATEEELRGDFATFGKVESITIPTDKYSGKARGFAFVEMPSISEGQAAIAALNGKTVKDRTLTVNAARPRSDSGSGGFYSDKRGGGYGGSRGGRSSGGRHRRY
jgi:cold-inducible RNA-binding protein